VPDHRPVELLEIHRDVSMAPIPGSPLDASVARALTSCSYPPVEDDVDTVRFESMLEVRVLCRMIARHDDEHAAVHGLPLGGYGPLTCRSTHSTPSDEATSALSLGKSWKSRGRVKLCARTASAGCRSSRWKRPRVVTDAHGRLRPVLSYALGA
jgi:hypothetical protein